MHWIALCMRKIKLSLGEPLIPTARVEVFSDFLQREGLRNSFFFYHGLMSALKDVISLLNTLVKRVDSNSKNIKSIQRTPKDAPSSSSSSDSSKIPPVV